MPDKTDVKYQKIYLAVFILVTCYLIVNLGLASFASQTYSSPWFDSVSRVVIVLLAVLFVIIFMGIDFWGDVMNRVRKNKKK
jgi:ribose/xylose/arabinose/galactoside ABC-type transport system permease subunit